jgi:hypothetical protein
VKKLIAEKLSAKLKQKVWEYHICEIKKVTY